MPTELEIIKYQWLTAMQAVEMADVEVARMMYWCKDPRGEAEPDLVTMIALWTEADEKSKLLEEDSIDVPDDDLPSVNQIKDLVATQEGYMLASEEYQSRQYQNILNRQLTEFVQATLSQLSNATDEEIEDILELRDTLEYARMGIHVIQMQGRLQNVNYDQFVEKLNQFDQRIRVDLKNHDSYKPPYVPSTFWWRN